MPDLAPAPRLPRQTSAPLPAARFRNIGHVVNESGADSAWFFTQALRHLQARQFASTSIASIPCQQRHRATLQTKLEHQADRLKRVFIKFGIPLLHSM